MGNVLHLSHAGLLFIAGWEAFSATEYPDVGGRPTIGDGHLINPKLPVVPSPPWTPAVALVQLAKDAALVEGFINAWVMPHLELAQNEFDAVCALVYNIGGGNFRDSHLLKYLQAGDRAHAANEFLVWDHVNHVQNDGLLRRRTEERAMFLGVPYQAHS